MTDVHNEILNRQHLAVLAAVAASSSLSAAAATVHQSQSALSHSLSRLEARLGLELLDRRTRPIQLTEAGRLLAERANGILAAFADTERELANLRARPNSRLHIALECHTCIEWLAPALDVYRHEFPAVDLDVRLGSAFDPLPGLRAGSCDLVISGETHDRRDVIAEPLFRYDIVGVVPAGHPLAQRDFLEPKDFRAQTVITYPVNECRLDLYTRFLELEGVVPAGRRTAELTTLILQWAASGLGVAALPRWAIPPERSDVAIMQLGRDGLHADLRALRRSGDDTMAHLNACVSIIRRSCFARLPAIRPVPQNET